QDLTITGNGGDGVLITGAGTDQNTLRNNWIGAQDDVGGNVNGVVIEGGARSNHLGEEVASGAGNEIRGNRHFGVEIEGSGPYDNRVLNSGIKDNGERGVWITRGATSTHIGRPFMGNSIWGSPVCVEISSPDTSGNDLENNEIGTSRHAVTPSNYGVL